jgi:hypothetical protein
MDKVSVVARIGLAVSVTMLCMGLIYCLAAIANDPGGSPSPGFALAAAPDSRGAAERVRDCTTEAKLSRENRSVVHYVVWCGVQEGPVTLRIRPSRSLPVLRFSHVAQATGPGASGPLRCRPHAWRVFCSGRKSGPVTFRGSFTLALGKRCAAPIKLNVWRWTGDSHDFATGCPKSYEAPVRRLRQIIEDRAFEGLDRDLNGDREAIRRRAKALLQAWRRGDPVARWTYEEEAFGMPLRAFEQVELEYREAYLDRFQHLVEEGEGPWVVKNAASSYAGYEVDSANGGIIYVGFTVEPEAMLEKLKRRLIAPERFKPFPVTPTYTLAELERIQDSLPEKIWRLVNFLDIDFLGNKVRVGTEHIVRVRRLIAEHYGPDAPFKVVFGRALIPF